MSDQHFANVVLGLSFDGVDGATAVTDWSGAPHAMTFNGNAQLDTAQFKWGTASLLCDGNADFVTTPDHADWSFGSSPFTVEGWLRFNHLNTAEDGCALCGHYNNTGNQRSWALYYDNSTGEDLTFIRSSDGTATTALKGAWPGGSPALNTWFHVAADRDANNTLRVYLNGVVLASEAISTFSFHNSTDVLSIGRLNSSAGSRRWLNGWLDELRITKGVARYAGAFNPPGGPFSRYKALGAARNARPANIGFALAA